MNCGTPAGAAAAPVVAPEPPKPPAAPVREPGDLLSGKRAAECLWLNSRPANQFMAPDGTRYLKTPLSAADLPPGIQGLAYKAAYMIRGVEYVDLESSRVLAVVAPAPAPPPEPAPAQAPPLTSELEAFADDPLPPPAPPPAMPPTVLPPPPPPPEPALAPPAAPVEATAAAPAPAELVQTGHELVQAFQKRFGTGQGSAARVEEVYARLDDLKAQYEHYQSLGVEWMHGESLVFQVQQYADASAETARRLLGFSKEDYARLRHAMISSARLREAGGQ